MTDGFGVTLNSAGWGDTGAPKAGGDACTQKQNFVRVIVEICWGSFLTPTYALTHNSDTL